MSIAVIILAAGSSSRLGQSKQLLNINNETLLKKVCRTALNSKADKVVVVLGSDYKKHKEVIEDIDVETVFHSDWENGMGSSLKSGLQFLLSKSQQPEAVIISVCDQPELKSEVLDQLVTLHHKHPEKIIASKYLNTMGVPVLFGAKWFPVLLNIADAAGAKSIIKLNSSEVIPLPFDQGVWDIDTPEDLKRFFRE